MKSKILVVDDEPGIIYSIERCFASDSVQVLSATNGKDAVQVARAERPDVVLLDIRLPDQGGLEVFQELRKLDSRMPVILMTAYAKAETAIEAISRGAFDYLLKPWDLANLRLVVSKALDIGRKQRTAAVIESEEEATPEAELIIGRSAIMQEVYKQIGRVAPHNYPVLITGESGTGKELIARAIYHYSTRRDQPFLAINCAALPETLLESELFGHEKGAFTGAEQRRIGKFEQLNGGTILLDEIGDMTPATQAKALRLLQDQQFERLGGSVSVRTNVRIIAATNRNLAEEVQHGRFRLDLWYRLNGYTIELPPLRERREDIPRLASYFLKKLCAEQGRPPCTLSDEALNVLMRHAWPGNIRELSGALTSALLNTQGDVIVANDLPESCHAAAGDALMHSAAAHDFALLTRQYLDEGRHDAYRHLLAEFDKIVLGEAWQKFQGNQAKICEQLGLARMTLRGKLRELGLLPAETTRSDN